MTPNDALSAIRARIQGVWDNPALASIGPLGDADYDILRILDLVDTPSAGDVTPDMLAVLKEAYRMVGAYVLALERGRNATDATHARYVERQIAETIVKADSASQPATDCREYDWRNG